MKQLIENETEIELLEKFRELAKKGFGRLVVEKHDKTLYIELTEKTKYQTK